MDLVSSGDARFIPIEPDMMQKIIAAYPYYNASVIPAGTYPEIDKDIPAVGAGTIVITNSTVSDDLVYKFTKAIMEHAKELAQVHPAGKEYGPKTALRENQKSLFTRERCDTIRKQTLRSDAAWRR